jgi:hypothetical protein
MGKDCCLGIEVTDSGYAEHTWLALGEFTEVH